MTGKNIFLIFLSFYRDYTNVTFSMVSSGQPFPMSKLVFMYVKRLAEPLGMDSVPGYIFKN